MKRMHRFRAMLRALILSLLAIRALVSAARLRRSEPTTLAEETSASATPSPTLQAEGLALDLAPKPDPSAAETCVDPTPEPALTAEELLLASGVPSPVGEAVDVAGAIVQPLDGSALSAALAEARASSEELYAFPKREEGAQKREMDRRAFTLAAAVSALGLGLGGFYLRQSTITRFDPNYLTRVWLPAARLAVKPVAAVGTAAARAVPVLVYHGIVPVGESCNLTPETFIDHMTTLKLAGYTTLTMQQFADFIANGVSVPERSVLITFDDGRTDSFLGADPVLEALGFHATMFTILGSARSRKSFYLTPAENKMLAGNGRWDLHSHTTDQHHAIDMDPMGIQGHALATRAWDSSTERLESDSEYEWRVKQDLLEARAGLAELSGSPVYAFAYPYGDYGQDSEDRVIKDRLPSITSAIYPLSFVQQHERFDETYNYGFDNGSMMRRIYITHDVTAEQLMARLERGLPKSLPLTERRSFGSSGWVVSEGQLDKVAFGGGRELASSPGEGRAEAFLDGARAWEDYVVRTRLTMKRSQTVSMIVRRAARRDYLAVTLSPPWASVEQVIGGKRTLLTQADLEFPDRSEADIRVSVDRDVVQLFINGREVLTADGVADSLRRGGVGVRVDPRAGARAKLRLDAFSVLPISQAVADAAEAADAGMPDTFDR